MLRLVARPTSLPPSLGGFDPSRAVLEEVGGRFELAGALGDIFRDSQAEGLGQFAYGPYGASAQTQTVGNASSRSEEYNGVAYTIDDMRRMTRDALTREQNAPLRRLCMEITAQVNPKDYLSESAALYYYLLKNLRYVRDPVHIEHVQHPLVVLQPDPWDRAAGRKARADDCETIASTMAAMQMQLGNPSQFMTLSTQHGTGHHHVLCVSQVTGAPGGGLVAFDPVAGPNVTRMLSSVVDHKLWRIEPVRIPSASGWGVAGERAGSGMGFIGPDVPPERLQRMTEAANRHAVCANPDGMGWTTPDLPYAQWTGPCALNGMPVYSPVSR